MFVRLMIGPRAGEIVEMKFSDAKPLLDDGRATLAYVETPAPAPPLPVHSASLPAKAAPKTVFQKGKRK